MINLGVYVSEAKVIEKTTGVGKHTIGMIRALSKIKNINLFNEIPSLIEISNECAICCRNENIYSIAQEINKLKNDKNYRDKFVNLNLYNASKYNWDKFSDILVSLIKNSN